jgi:outer membrane protein assembly factor BamB
MLPAVPSLFRLVARAAHRPLAIRFELYFLAGAVATAIAGNAVAQSPMFRGDPAHHGVSIEPPVTHFGGIQWRVATGGMVRASPTITGGLVIVGGSDSTVYAIGLANGTVRWRYPATGPVSSTAALAEGLAFVQSDDGTLHAIDVREGRARWTRPGGAPVPLGWGHENGDYFTSSPVVADGLVIVGGRDGLLVARDVATGRERWHYSAECEIWGSPAVADGVVVVGDQCGRVHAVLVGTGARRWRFRTVGDTLVSASFGFDRRTIQSSPAIWSGTVLVGARDGFLYAIDLATGRERWRYDHNVSWVNASPAVDGRLVYATSSDGAFAQAVDLATGKEVWRAAGLGISWSSPLVAGDLVYVTTGTGWVYGLDRATGTRRWAWRADGAVWSSPVLAAGGLLVFGSDDGGIYAVRGADRDLERVVWWDSAAVRTNLFAGHLDLRDYLASRGWRVLNTDSTARFLADRTADRAPSVVVFAEDQVPVALGAEPADTTPLRRYLDAGGKVVWLGTPPYLWPRDTTGLDLRRIDRDACGPALGIDCGPANFNDWRVTPTEEGRRWGLEGWWIARWSVRASSVSTVLAFDQRGDASSFVQEFGGGPGTGFVRLGGGDISPVLKGPRHLDPAMVRRVAEYRPLRTKGGN